ncbi:DUF916 domain-containing protein [Cytobacillus purgationiresistens]|uniref:DUF3324 domain-containing protein n=1 Tax=Cytobacillus purgationiresistens TaxID=863449 RepID=A0ABU0AKK0_9BACI|nr:DUF916 domain-containing protein [Cytobacillus purgationiresistens]MDQ0271251.1 hypothetical protein [Cytobacillus purgationiresistens]
MRNILKMLLISSLCFTFASNAKAESTKPTEANTQNIPYEIKLHLPKNQVEGIKSFFDINVKPGTTQTFEVSIQNLSPEDIKIGIESANAINSPRGGIVYKKEKGDQYSFLTDDSFYMDEHINVANEIVIGPHQSKKIPVVVNIPDSREKGTLLGGIIFKDLTERERNVSKESGQLSLKGKIELAQALGIKMNLSSSAETIPLDVNNASNRVIPSGAFIEFELENSNADIVEDISFSYKVIDKKENMIFKGEIPEFNVAPKAKVSMEIPWTGETYQPGEYKLILQPSFEDQPFISDFSINREDVKTYAAETGQKVYVPILNLPVYAWFIFVVLLLIGLYLSYKYGKKKTTNKDNSIDAT